MPTTDPKIWTIQHSYFRPTRTKILGWIVEFRQINKSLKKLTNFQLNCTNSLYKILSKCFSKITWFYGDFEISSLEFIKWIVLKRHTSFHILILQSNTSGHSIHHQHYRVVLLSLLWKWSVMKKGINGLKKCIIFFLE